MPRKSMKKNPVKKVRDTVHVPTTGGYKIVVKKNSPFHKQAKKHGSVINEMRPASRASGGKSKDPLSVKNYNKRKKK